MTPLGHVLKNSGKSTKIDLKNHCFFKNRKNRKMCTFDEKCLKKNHLEILVKNRKTGEFLKIDITTLHLNRENIYIFINPKGPKKHPKMTKITKMRKMTHFWSIFDPKTSKKIRPFLKLKK